MVTQYNRTPYLTGLLVDMASVVLAWLVAYIIRFQLSPDIVPSFYPRYFHAIIVILMICLFVFKSLGNYSIQAGEFSLQRDIWNVIHVNIISFALVLALSFFYREYEYSRIIAVLFWCFSVIFMSLNRIVLRFIWTYLCNSKFYSRTAVIIGNGELAKRIASVMATNPFNKIQILGFVDDTEAGVGLLGRIEDLEKIIESKQPDYLYIALPYSEYNKIDTVMSKTAEFSVTVRIVTDIFSFPTLRLGISTLFDYPIIHITDTPLEDGWNRFLKRSFDIIFSAMILFFLSPLLAIIAIMVKLTSNGPVLYRQQRMGLDGKIFEMLKFRTMRTDAEAATGPVWATANDQRTTPMGSFLRKTSIDELPQFWNVFKGEMSVVGPRPERPVFIERFKKEIPNYMLRHKMKAGITGWAQVNGWRGNTSLTKRVEYDIFYIENWSFSLDLKIVFLTLFKGFVNENAY